MEMLIFQLEVIFATELKYNLWAWYGGPIIIRAGRLHSPPHALTEKGVSAVSLQGNSVGALFLASLLTLPHATSKELLHLEGEAGLLSRSRCGASSRADCPSRQPRGPAGLMQIQPQESRRVGWKKAPLWPLLQHSPETSEWGVVDNLQRFIELTCMCLLANYQVL